MDANYNPSQRRKLNNLDGFTRGFLAVIYTGRFRDCVPSPETDRQYAACEAEVFTGPRKLMRWGVPAGRPFDTLRASAMRTACSSAPPPAPPQITLCPPRSGKDLERGATSLIWGRRIYLTAVLDRLKWSSDTPLLVSQARDPLAEMDRAY